MNSFSQHKEDKHIFDFIEKKEYGTYIDIGAGFPKHISNTYALYELGWRGLAIEPCPMLTHLWKIHRPEDILYKGCVLDRIGTVAITTKGHFAVNKDAWIFESHRQRAVNEGFPVQDFVVPCTTLFELIRKIAKGEMGNPGLLVPMNNLWEPDFVSIDIDGSELALLGSLDFDRFKPKLILIEHSLRGVDQTYKWGHYLESHYEKVWDNDSDAFYLRRNI